MAPLRLPAFLVLALLAAPAGADEVSDLLQRAREGAANVQAPQATFALPPACTDGIAARPGKFCENLDDCMRFCSCACSFDVHQWKPNVKNDGSTTCGARMPETGIGMLPPDSADLVPIPTTWTYLAVPRGITGTRDVYAGLKSLADSLAASAERTRLGYTVRVGSCYRRHLEDTVPECGFVLKAKYMLAKSTDSAYQSKWRENGDPTLKGLTWPGRTPHSGGYACDIVLVDRSGGDCHDSRAGVDGAPVCAIDARTAVDRLLAETSASGAKRLTFEAWHFEWGANASGCAGEACSAYWPVTGKPGNRP